MSINVNPINYFLKVFVGVFTSFKKSVREINLKYAKPKAKITPMVKISLIVLRLYLISMILILIYKFISIAF